jgi:hypothetical protein
MTWECPRCGSVYPDSDGGLPEDLAADDKDGCLACHGDPDRWYRDDTDGGTYRIVSTWEIEADSAAEAKEEFNAQAHGGQLPGETWKLLAPGGQELEVRE